jgi:hypothetical protein
MKTEDEILHVKFETDDEIAELIYNNIFARSRDGRFCAWKDTPYKAPETENGFVARLCVDTANEIRQSKTDSDIKE